VPLGNYAPIAIQSMTNTDTRDVSATVAQIKQLCQAGCEIIRVAVPDSAAAAALGKIKKQIAVPLIADVHFDHRLALDAIKNGADGVRINPGNIPLADIRRIIRAAKERDTVIRLGINAGSLQKDVAAKYGGATADALVESALCNIAVFEEEGFSSLKISLKSSDVPTMIEAYRRISARTDYPLHLGVTEAGTEVDAAVKSALGIGILLYEGIGDTFRVSVTGDPLREIPIAQGILRSLRIRMMGPDIISCPTCGRCEIDLPPLVEKVRRALAGTEKYIKIALMGCVVNGPGEAADADIGIAGGKGAGMLFKKGKAVKKIKEEDFLSVILAEIKRMLEEKKEA